MFIPVSSDESPARVMLSGSTFILVLAFVAPAPSITSTESGTSFTSSSGRVAVTTSSEHVSPTVEHSCPFSFISVKPVSTL